MEIFWTLAFLSLVVLILQYLYKFLKKPYSYWRDRGVPSAPGYPVIGSLYDTFTGELHLVMQERYKKYGRVHGYYEAHKPVLTVADPELLKDILIKDFQNFTDRRDASLNNEIFDTMVASMRGEEWKRVRTLMTPAFSSGKIKKMASIILDAAEITLKNLEKHADNKENINCKEVFGAFTMDVIARSAFGIKIDSRNEGDNELVKHARETFNLKLSLGLILFFLSPRLVRLLNLEVFAGKAAYFFKDVTLGIIKQRKETGQRQNDFLQLLLDIADETLSSKDEEIQEDDSEKSINDFGHDQQNKQTFKQTKKYKSLSYNEMVSQCVLFFLAGYATTAAALSFVSYLLALNPECQETLIKEIDETLNDNEKKLTYEAVQSMKYLENVIWETLRIYPPSVLLERQAIQDYKLGSTGITIPKGMLLSIPTYAIHHDSEFYENPEKFDPNRFTTEEKNQRNPFSYLPFGAGPRNCLGMRFALIEIKMCIASMLSKFRLKKCPKTQVPLQFLKGFGGGGLLQPSSEILLSIERRKDSVFS